MLLHCHLLKKRKGNEPSQWYTLTLHVNAYHSAGNHLEYGPCHEKTCLCCIMRTTKTQTSPCIRAVWSAPSLFSQLGIYPTRFLSIAFFQKQLLKHIVLTHIYFWYCLFISTLNLSYGRNAQIKVTLSILCKYFSQWLTNDKLVLKEE